MRDSGVPSGRVTPQSESLLALAARCEREEPSDELDARIAIALRVLPGNAEHNTFLDRNYPNWLVRTDGRIEAERGGVHWAPYPYTTSLDAAVTLVPEDCGIELQRYWMKKPGVWWSCGLAWGRGTHAERVMVLDVATHKTPLARTREVEMTKPLCIYHGGCDDGFGAAYVVRLALGNDVDFFPGVYQSDPPDVTGRDVVLVDFSYKRPVLEAMAAKAKSVLILDHHKTAAEDLAGFKPPYGWADHLAACGHFPGEVGGSNVAALFDMERSGTGLAWDYFRDGLPRPPFVNYIEDRDLWRKTLTGGDEFTICLRSHPQDFAVWEKLLGNGDAVPKMISEGRAIQRYYRARVEELKRHAYETKINGVPCWITNAPYFAASEVAGELCDQPGAAFGACYFEVEKGKYTYSLRSRGDFDVSAVAKQFGGGGHKNAAGFKAQGIVHQIQDIPAFLAKTPVPLP